MRAPNQNFSSKQLTKHAIYIILSKLIQIRLHGQAVKTPPFHGGNRGSIPLGVTIKLHALENAVFAQKRRFQGRVFVWKKWKRGRFLCQKLCQFGGRSALSFLPTFSRSLCGAELKWSIPSAVLAARRRAKTPKRAAQNLALTPLARSLKKLRAYYTAWRCNCF